ncbi:hypothetical protein ACK8P5_26460 (plasmid) [Paenibacillus sp. EC2-1]|uniref:hypothetical protein n=1 Tax=Paenibacillus sp. EC2-1 TaxID=3388665 RepID=UPI003BEEBA46
MEDLVKKSLSRQTSEYVGRIERELFDTFSSIVKTDNDQLKTEVSAVEGGVMVPEDLLDLVKSLSSRNPSPQSGVTKGNWGLYGRIPLDTTLHEDEVILLHRVNKSITFTDDQLLSFLGDSKLQIFEIDRLATTVGNPCLEKHIGLDRVGMPKRIWISEKGLVANLSIIDRRDIGQGKNQEEIKIMFGISETKVGKKRDLSYDLLPTSQSVLPSSKFFHLSTSI